MRREDESRRNTRSDKASRHGESAAHLLNFTYASPRGEGGDGAGNRRAAVSQWRRVGGRQPVHTKEQFLQAHCQFVLRKSVPEDSCAPYLTDADKMVDWDDIEQVVSVEDIVITVLVLASSLLLDCIR